MDAWNTSSFPFGGKRLIFRGELAVSFRECTSVLLAVKLDHGNLPSCFGGPRATILTNEILRNTTTLMLTGAPTILWSINSMRTIPLLVLFDHKCVSYWNIYQCSSSLVWNETKLFSYSTMKKKCNQRLTARNCSIVTIPVAMKIGCLLTHWYPKLHPPSGRTIQKFNNDNSWPRSFGGWKPPEKL